MTMMPDARPLLQMLRRMRTYRRAEPLVLVNGLAEQAESWFANRAAWSRRFDVKVPELLIYDGPALHKHIDAGGEVTVDYLASRLATYLDEFVQRPPYHLVGSSLGGQIVLTYAARNAEKVAKIVLICPSGVHGAEHLPVMEGVRRADYGSLVGSVFTHQKFATDELVGALARKFADRKWKSGVLRTLRGTMGHSVAHLLTQISHPCLLIWGADDRVIADVPGAIRAAMKMPRSRQVVIPKCGHAPQIEKSGLVNALVDRFLRDKLDGLSSHLDPSRFLKHTDRMELRVR